ncbi:hypothetical protein [Nonomuraea longicatena]|uniref:Uncharacterized protein n=1 Tax=Nonomuraea longicatena TaxID=83682 RepID=A0ABN1Q993_9ACTN
MTDPPVPKKAAARGKRAAEISDNRGITQQGDNSAAGQVQAGTVGEIHVHVAPPRKSSGKKSPDPPDEGRRRLLLMIAVGAVGTVGLAGGGFWVQQNLTQLTPVFGGGWEALFASEEIGEVFRRQRLDVDVNNLSGIDMTYIQGEDLDRYHFFLCPADSIAAAVKNNFRASGQSPSNPRLVFQAPMVVLVHRALLECLVGQSLVRSENGFHVFDVLRYLDHRLKKPNWTWGSIGAPEAVAQGDSQVEVVSGAPCSAGGGDLYLSLLIHAHRKNYRTDKVRLVNDLQRLFLNSWPASSSGLLQEFFSSQQYPMAFVYEHDALKYLADQQGIAPDNYRLLYPDPGVISKHLFVGRDDEDGSELVGDLLTSREVQQIMARRFFLRGADAELFEQAVIAHGMTGCIRQGDAVGSLALPIPSDIAPFPRPDLMIEFRNEIVACA